MALVEQLIENILTRREKMTKKIGKIIVPTEPARRATKITGFTFKSYDKNAGVLQFEIQNQDGSPTDLLDATVRLFMYIYQGEEKKEFPIFDNQIITESYMQGIVKYPIPDMLLSYEGKVDANVYVDFPDGSYTDNLAFTFVIEKSVIDHNIQVNGDYYFKDFMQLIEAASEQSNQLVGNFSGEIEELASEVNQSLANVEQKAVEVEKNLNKIEELYEEADTYNKKQIDAKISEKGERTVVEKNQEEIYRLQTTKADQAFVDAQFATIVSGAPKGTYNTFSELQAAYPNGTDGIFLVLENGHWYYWQAETTSWEDGGVYQSTDIQVASITPDKIAETTIQGSTNLFNLKNVIYGEYVDNNTGSFSAADNEQVYHSEYIPISGGKRYKFSSWLGIPGAWFDAGKEFIRSISRADTTNMTDQAPENAAYLVWNGDAQRPATSAMITEFDENYPSYPNHYLPYQEIASVRWLEPMGIEIANFPVSEVQANLFDSETITRGHFINNESVLTENERFAVSDYIPVKPNTVYSVPITFNAQGYYFNELKEPICAIQHTEASNNNNRQFKTPSTARYVRLNLYVGTTGSSKGNENFFSLTEGENVLTKATEYGVNQKWLNPYSKKLFGKKIVTFGDSITWYDHQLFVDKTTMPNTRAIGYQTYLRSAFGCKISNQGISGQNTKQIGARSKSFDYSDYSLVTFLAGVNDFGQSRAIGTVQTIGSSFDENTYCGAYQSMLEDVLKRFPTLRIGIIIPYKVWNTQLGGLMPREFTDKLVEIAKLYSIPYLNLYDEAQINEVNKDVLFVDDTSQVPYQYHLNNEGYQMISRHIVSFVNQIIG